MPDTTTSVLTQRNDNSRTGAYVQETQLNTSNVNTNLFGKLFEYHLDGHVYAQPLVVSNIDMPDGNTHNVVYIATMHNTVYAFDADNQLAANSPLWTKSLGPSVGLPDANIGRTHQGQPIFNGAPVYGDIAHEVGILSTPVISLSHNAIYVVAATKEGNTYSHRLHALDLATRAEKFGGPTPIGSSTPGGNVTGPSVPGTGAGSVNGRVTFTSNRQIQRSALLLANDTIYIAFAAYGDAGPYHGWVLAYNATTLQRTAVYNTTPNGSGGGIWQGGQGPIADSDGNIYFLTGNGSFDGNTQTELGDSFVKLSPHLTLEDWFSPFNNSVLNKYDKDVGSSGALLLPGTNLLVGGGKESKIYLIDKDHMDHFRAGGDSQIIQSFYINTPEPPGVFVNPNVQPPGDPLKTHHIHGAPVCWDGPNGPCIYAWTENDNLKAYQFDGGKFQTAPLTKGSTVSPGMPGGMLSVSANGNTAGTSIVWGSRPKANANRAVVPGVLHAYDASDLTNELWNSEQNAQPQDAYNFATFCSPTIANGKVYMATFSGKVMVYGLIGQ